MSANKLTALALLSLLGATSVASGQGLGNSPYSRLGLGDFNYNTGGVRQQGMGGVGLSAPNAVQINELNPALVYYVNRTTYEAAFTGQYKTLRNATASQKVGSATLGYLALAVPISRRWGLAVGLKPLTSVDYKSVQTERVAGDPTAQVLKEYSGTGGLSEVYLAQGIRLAKGLSVGLTSSYVFGSIDRSTSSLLFPADLRADEALEKVVITDHVEYRDFSFRTGLHYRRELNKTLSGNIGAVYTFESSLNGTRNQEQTKQDVNGTPLQATPTILMQDVKGETTLPGGWQVGVGIDNGKNWSVNADVARQSWSKYRDFGLTTTPLNDAWRVAVGGEMAPDPSSVNSYLKRIVYRVGLSSTQSAYRPGGQDLYDRAVHWGFSLPFPSSSALDATTLNLSFAYGQRGNTDVLNVDGRTQANIKEDYVRAQLGFTLNSRWFLKRKIE